MTNHPSPTAARSSKFTKDAVARVKVEGKEHLLWKRVPWNPGKGTEASLRTVQRSKAKRCEAGPVSPCNPGKGTNASLRTGKVRQVQSLVSGKYDRSRKGPKKQGQISRQDRPTGDVSKALRWIVTTSWSCKGGKKESLEDHLKSCTVQPFPLESTSTVLG